MSVDLTKVCSVCLEEMESPLWLGCHVFCKECVISWLHKSATCPTCRGDIPDVVLDILPRRSTRRSRATMMFTTNGDVSYAVSSREMMQRVENIDKL